MELKFSVNSSSLNAKDYEYFKANFEVETNCDTLEEAEVILIGENHGILEHRIKECWLLHKLSKPQDVILLETGNGDDFARENFAYNFHYFPPIVSEIKGWDSMIWRSKGAKNLAFLSQQVSILEKYLNDSPRDFSTLRKLILEILGDEVIKNKNSKFIQYAHKENILNSDEYKNIILQLSELEKKYKEYSSSISEIPESRLNLLFYEVLGNLSSQIIWSYKLFSLIEVYHRNVSLAENVSFSPHSSLIQKKKWVIAGKGHLRDDNSANSAAVRVFRETINSSKFILLFPTDSNKNSIVATKYLSSFKYSYKEMLKEFILSEKLFSISIITIIASGVFFDYNPEFFSVLFCTSTISSIFAASKEIYKDYQHKSCNLEESKKEVGWQDVSLLLGRLIAQNSKIVSGLSKIESDIKDLPVFS